MFCFVESQAAAAAVFTAIPPNPFTVVEGSNITLEWSYDLGGGSFRRIEFTKIASSFQVLILEVDTVGQTPVYLNNDYIGRLQVNVTATQTSITIIGANRTVDGNDYQFGLVFAGSPPIFSAVTISVQGKYTSRSVQFLVLEIVTKVSNNTYEFGTYFHFT